MRPYLSSIFSSRSIFNMSKKWTSAPLLRTLFYSALSMFLLLYYVPKIRQHTDPLYLFYDVLQNEKLYFVLVLYIVRYSTVQYSTVSSALTLKFLLMTVTFCLRFSVQFSTVRGVRVHINFYPPVPHLCEKSKRTVQLGSLG